MFRRPGGFRLPRACKAPRIGLQRNRFPRYQKRWAEAHAMRVLLPRGYSGGSPGSNSAGHLLAPGPWALRCPWWWTQINPFCG